MVTITLPPDVEAELVKEAEKQGTTPELLAVDCLRNRFAPAPEAGADEKGSLFDFLSGYIGTVDGSREALSERTGERFTEGMLEKHRRRRP
jgi:hypothetical protein